MTIDRFHFTFNDVSFKELITVESVERNLLPPVKNITNSNVKVAGSRLVKHHLEENKIEVTFNYVGKEIAKNRRMLGQLLYSDDLKKLTFSDEPHLYYLAKVDGDTNFDEGYQYGKGKITFLVPSGVAYSVEEKTQTFRNASLIRLKNEGTYRYYPVVEATMKSDNMFFALTSPHGTYQFGDAMNIDRGSFSKKTTDLLVDDELDNVSTWSAFDSSQLANYPVKRTGSYQSQKSNFYPNYGTGSGCFGASISRSITKQTEGWNYEAWINFASRNPQEFGLIRLSVMNGSNEVAGLVLLKENTTKYVKPIFIVNNQIQAYLEDYSNLFSDFMGKIEITCTGDEVRFSLSDERNGRKIVKSIYSKDIQNTSVNQITLITAKYGTREPLSQVWWRKIRFVGYNVSEYSAVDNLLLNGDVLKIDMSTNKAYVNGTPLYNPIRPGSKALFVEPGEAEWMISVSDFASKPDVKVTYREVFL